MIERSYEKIKVEIGEILPDSEGFGGKLEDENVA